MEIARALSELLSEQFEYNSNPNSNIAWVVTNWGTNEKVKLKERWESFHRKKQELVKAMDGVEGRTFYDRLEVKRDKEQPGQGVFTLPVIVEVVKDEDVKAGESQPSTPPSNGSSSGTPPKPGAPSGPSSTRQQTN
jgi:hypothetical protein